MTGYIREGFARECDDAMCIYREKSVREVVSVANANLVRYQSRASSVLSCVHLTQQSALPRSATTSS